MTLKCNKQLKIAIAIIFFILLVDQISKIYIKTNFSLGEEVFVFEWFRIHFIENNGMAWGVEFGGKVGKLFLTFFRLIAITAIGFWLYDSIKKQQHKILIIAVSMILAGALGNIIDSVFYGIIFTESYPGIVATVAESGQGYNAMFHGKVVDMFYFPIWSGYLPEWLPFWGGNYFTFFNAIFNVADSAITLGVTLLIIFNKQVFPEETAIKDITN
ncbi:MAG: lipoprotein signal peptidase [Bacteroidetes bacterium]|nr:lipoprotein signal peptidase [Bacteroidota bacterium]